MPLDQDELSDFLEQTQLFKDGMNFDRFKKTFFP